MSDPGLLDDEVWRLFPVPDAGKTLDLADRTAHWTQDIDDAPRQTWARAWRICAAGKLDRDRLLDACLGVQPRLHAEPRRLVRQAAGRAGASVDEIAAREPNYLGLLGAPQRWG